MNIIQTERLENHTARFKVEIEFEQLEKAKQTAARKIARQVNIPGFRKGKAPYRILANYVGEAAILEEAVEELGNEVYKEALKKAELEPYGPGEIENFEIEPKPTFTFSVALQPSVQLGDYRSIRRDYQEPAVEDEAVDRAMRMVQEQQALVEESRQPVASGNRITIDIHSYFVDQQDAEDEQPEGDAETETPSTDAVDAETAAEHEDHDHEHGESDIHAHVHEDDDVFLHEHNFVVNLSPDNEPIIPGFIQAMEGATVDELREFELSFPDDREEYEDLAGRRVKFHVSVKKIETVTLPALNDDFAARVTEKEEKPLTLLELRMRVRENLQKEAVRRAKSDYASDVLDQVIEQAAIGFPEAMVTEQTASILEDLDNRMRQQGLTLDDYMRLTNKTRDDLNQDYRETAIRSLKRTLTLVEVVNAEKIMVSDQDIDQEIDEMITAYGEQAASLRKAFDTPRMRANILNDLLSQRVFDRLFEIGTGQAPELPADSETSAPGEVSPAEAGDTTPEQTESA